MAAHEGYGYDGWADVLAMQCEDLVSFFSGHVLIGHRASFRLAGHWALHPSGS